jgi:uncharacterized protein (TIGR03437 family)
LALLNQYLVSKGLQSQPGLGNVNPAVYRLAQSSPAAFHDITDGNNMVPCAAGTPNCTNGTVGFTAGPGYDLASGLGSIDIFQFVTNWPGAGATTTTVTVSTSTVSITDSLQLTAAVATPSGGGTPTGTVTFSQGTSLLGTATLSAAATGNITVSGGQLAPGNDVVIASYSGDTAFSGSAGNVSITVTVPASNSAVVPTITPNPVYQDIPDSDGFVFFYSMKLTEIAGMATTLTSFTINGQSETIATFFNTTAIPAHGSIVGGIRSKPIPVPATRIYGFSGKDANGFQWTQQVPVQFFGPVFRTFISGISNAASGQTVYAPGMLLSVYGAGLASSTQIASALPLPLQLANTTATVNGVPAPLYFVSPGQVNLQIPYETAVGNAVLVVKNNGEQFSFSFNVSAAGPGIFTNSKNNPVPFPGGSRGQVYILYITGEGQVSPPLATGATPPATTPVSQLPAPVLPVSMTIGQASAAIVFVGIPSGLAGVTQVNFVVPPNAPLGPQSMVITVGRASSAPATFTVTQ